MKFLRTQQWVVVRSRVSKLIDKFIEVDGSTTEVRSPETLSRQENLPNILVQQSDSQHPSTPQGDSATYSKSASGNDSGYASLEGTPTNESSAQFGNITKTARKKLKVFKRPVPEAFRHRYLDLGELFGSSLHEYVENKNKDSNLGTIVWKLQVLGETEESAKPWIVVMCSSTAAKTVINYFQQNLVRQECQPEDTAIPSFKVFVCEWPVRRLAAMCVYSDVESAESTPFTYSGKMVYTCINGKSRRATCGGIVKMVDTRGRAMFYGMTAGHIFEDDDMVAGAGDPGSVAPNILEGEDSDSWIAHHETQDTTNDTDETERRRGGGGEGGGGEGGNFVVSLEDGFELDLDDSCMELEPSGITAKLGKQTPANSVRIGKLSLRSTDNCKQMDCDLDWALLRILPRLKRLSRLWPRYIECKNAQPGTPVWIMTSRGALPGELQSSAFMKSSHATRAIEIFVVQVTGQQPAANAVMLQSHESDFSLGLGDSGSWVIDQSTEEVYGYIVASDIFRDAYVMPFKLAIVDIQNATKAVAFTLLTDADCYKLRDERLFEQDSPDASNQASLGARGVETQARFFRFWGHIRNHYTQLIRPVIAWRPIPNVGYFLPARKASPNMRSSRYPRAGELKEPDFSSYSHCSRADEVENPHPPIYFSCSRADELGDSRRADDQLDQDDPDSGYVSLEPSPRIKYAPEIERLLENT